MGRRPGLRGLGMAWRHTATWRSKAIVTLAPPPAARGEPPPPPSERGFVPESLGRGRWGRRGMEREAPPGGASGPAVAWPGREVLAQGWLRKQGRRPGAGWAPRFCILHGPRLDYYAKAGSTGLRALLGWARPDSALVDVELRGSLLMAGARVEEDTGVAAEAGAFRLVDARGKETVFQGMNVEDTQRWLGLVQQAIADRGGAGGVGAGGVAEEGDGLDIDVRDTRGCLHFLEDLPDAAPALKALEAALGKLRYSSDLPGPEAKPARGDDAPGATVGRCCRRLGEAALKFFTDLSGAGGALSPGAPGSAREQQLRRVAQNITLYKVHDDLFCFLREVNSDRDCQLAGSLHRLSSSGGLAPLLASPHVVALQARGAPALEALRAGRTPYEKAMALKDATAAIVDVFDSEEREARRAGGGASTDDILSRLVLLLTAAPCPDLCAHAALMEHFVDVCDDDCLKGELGYHVTNLLVACEFILRASPASFLEHFQEVGSGPEDGCSPGGEDSGEDGGAVPGRDRGETAVYTSPGIPEAISNASPAKSPFRRSVPALPA